jgi:hypothetical protein
MRTRLLSRATLIAVAAGVSAWLPADAHAAGPPIILRHANVRVEATSPQGAVVKYAPAIVRHATSVRYTKRSATVFPLGTTVVGIIATNRFGTSRRSFKVTVVDTTAPTLTPPPDVVTGATSAGGANVSYTVSATDIADSNVSVNCSPPSGSPFPVGTSVVTCTGRDRSGNTGTLTFRVVVTPPGVNASGRYVGTTTQNGTISFSVSGDGSQILNLTISADFTCSDDSTISGGGFTIGQLPISPDGTFSSSGSGDFNGGNFTSTYTAAFQGSFSPSHTANGTFRVHLVLSSSSGVECDTSPVLWTAPPA